MFDTISFSGKAKLREQFSYETTPWRSRFYEQQNAGDCLLAATWRCGVSRYEPGRRYGYPSIFSATHIATGLMVHYAQGQLISVSASLPRVLFGENRQHIHRQHEVDQALRKIFEIVDTVAEFKNAEEPWMFTRVDVTRPVRMPFGAFRQHVRFFRHSVSKKEPEVRDNSVHFCGSKRPSRSLFAYDKAVKEKLPPDGTTRVELRLFKRGLQMPAYAKICLPNLGLSLAEAAKCFRDTLREFPRVHSNPKEVPNLAHFLAELMCCKVERDGNVYDVLGRYAACCCKNREAARRMERRVVATVAQVTGFDIANAIIWDAPWPFECTPPPLPPA